VPATLPEELLAIMSREDGTQAVDRVRTEAPAGIQAEVPDKAAVPEKAVAIDGKIKKPGPEGPAFLELNKYAKSSDPFHENWTVLTMAKILTKYRGLK
jgi:hypothetical protein